MAFAMAYCEACQRHMMVLYCCGSGSTNKLFISSQFLTKQKQIQV